MPRTWSIVAVLGVLGVGIALWTRRPQPVPEPVKQAAPTAAVTASAAPAASVEAPPVPALATSVFADGRPVPDLPADAPKSVSFGVVLFTYNGAELAPDGARPKTAALQLAKDVVAEARSDFAAAVKKGDRGSTAQAGTMPRGVLEPNVEYLLFTLKKGEVYGEPVDTPRGFWVLRRNE